MGLCGLPDFFVLCGGRLQLIEKELVGRGEIGAKPFIELVWIALFTLQGCFVIGFEGEVDLFRVVDKIKHKGVLLAGAGAVQP